MRYLRWCINESAATTYVQESQQTNLLTRPKALRVHTVVGILGKAASRDTTLPRGGGPDGKSPVFVHKGALVIYSFFAQHRRKDLFGEDAHEFRPERWETLRPGWNYVPFNGGPRICVGQQYALTEAQYVVARFVQTFAAIESRDPQPWRVGNRLLTCPLGGVQVAVSLKG